MGSQWAADWVLWIWANATGFQASTDRRSGWPADWSMGVLRAGGTTGPATVVIRMEGQTATSGT
eukprot:gene34323-47209_t